VAINDARLVPSSQDGQWLDYPVDPAIVKQGDNTFAFGVRAGESAQPVLIDMLLWVRHPAAPPQ